MYKVSKDMFPDYICSMFNRTSLEDASYSLRSRGAYNFHIPMPHLEIFKYGLLYSGSSLWNRLSTEMKNASSIEIFKRLLKDV